MNYFLILLHPNVSNFRPMYSFCNKFYHVHRTDEEEVNNKIKKEHDRKRKKKEKKRVFYLSSLNSILNIKFPFYFSIYDILFVFIEKQETKERKEAKEREEEKEEKEVF